LQVGTGFEFQVEKNGRVHLYGVVKNYAYRKQFEQLLNLKYNNKSLHQEIGLIIRQVPKDGCQKWLSKGECGWEFSGELKTVKKRNLFGWAINEMQKQFKTVMKEKSDTYKALREELYFYDTNTFGSDSIDAKLIEHKKVSRKELWKQAANKPPTEAQVLEAEKVGGKARSFAADLQDAVIEVRHFLDVLLYLNRRQPKEAIDMLHQSGEGSDSPARRWKTIAAMCSQLMRCAEKNPDGPVQWAGHPPRNRFDKTTISSLSMLELVAGLHTIVNRLLFGLDVDMAEKLDAAMLDVCTKFREEFGPLSQSQIMICERWMKDSSLTEEHRRALMQPVQ